MAAAPLLRPLLLCVTGALVAALPQTPFQQRRFAEVQEQARIASQAALPELLGELATPAFRRLLAEACPSLAGDTTQSLLTRLRDYHQGAELASGFSGGDGEPPLFGPWDMSVGEGRRVSWFENQWEVRVRHGGSFRLISWFKEQDDVETRLYGLRPFVARGAPAGLEEAAERGAYIAVNAVGADMGTPLYGDVAAIFSTEALRNLTLISAVDTGGWTALCNSSGPKLPGWPPAAYHSACDYNFTLGTLDHFDHLILANLRYWRRDIPASLARQIAQTCHGDAPASDVHSSELFQYWEAIPAGRLVFPSSIKLLVASFPVLFGTSKGSDLQQWCAERGWALAWALGLNTGREAGYWSVGLMNRTFRDQGRLLDPTVLPATTITNVSVPDAAMRGFRELWGAVQARRRVWRVGNATWAAYWGDLAARLPKGLHVRPLRPGRCGAPSRCVGVALDGGCVCYAHDLR